MSTLNHEHMCFFDLMVVLLRFATLPEILQKMEEIIRSGLASGNLEILPLIGLNSDLVFPLL